MTSRPELILALNGLAETDWCSEDELMEFLQDKTGIQDPSLLRRTMEYALTAWVLTQTGTLIVRRRSVTESLARGFEASTSGQPEITGVDSSQLAQLSRVVTQHEAKLRALETRLDEQIAVRELGAIHWLQLHPAQMPRPLYDNLRSRAIVVVGKDATDQVVAAQMTLAAAQIIQLVLRPA